MLGLTNQSSGATVDATNTATGPAVRATINNSASSTNALITTTNGSGRALVAQTSGAGSTALIRNINGANNQTVLSVTNNGTGSVASIEALNAGGTQPAAVIRHAGEGSALVCEADSADKPTLSAKNTAPDAVALRVEGAITLKGTSALFSVVGQEGQHGFIPLDHPLLNDNPYAVVFVQPREHFSFGGAIPAGPRYIAHEGRWRVDAYGGGVHMKGFRFDILIFLRD